MKISRFLTLSETSDGKTLAWSSYTGALAKVDDEFLAVIDALKNGQAIDTDSHLVREMLRCGFVVDDEIDELAVYGELVSRAKQKSDTLKLIIAPTLDCNFSCPYCFETRKNVRMSRDIQDGIIRYVRKTLEAKTVKAFSVVWYGGEPLLEPEIIADLSGAFIEVCGENGVRYSASIITNGYLVDEGIAALLKECRVSFAQVTIDGKPETHNARRILRVPDAKGTYRRVVDGVKILTAHGINTAVRMNVDKSNAGGTEEAIAFLAEGIPDKSEMIFSPGQVVDYEGKNPDCLSNEEYSAVLLECMKQCGEYGVPFSRKFSLPKFRPSYCTATQSGGFVIDPEGLVYKCWNDIGIHDYSIGDIYGLSENGLVEEFSRSAWGRYSHMDYEVCRECRLLPVCAGGCPRGAVHFGRSPKCEAGKYILDWLLEDQYMTVKGGAKHGDSDRAVNASA